MHEMPTPQDQSTEGRGKTPLDALDDTPTTMSGFTFDFLVGDPSPQEATDPTASTSTTTTATTAASLKDEARRRPFVWIDNLEACLSERRQQEVACDEIDLSRPPDHDDDDEIDDENDDDDDDDGFEQPERLKAILRRVDIIASSFADGADWQATDSDLVSGVYEGGLKVWECSMDMVRYFYENSITVEDQSVLELGCGHALPSLYLLRNSLFSSSSLQGLAENKNETAKSAAHCLPRRLVVIDYNETVLRDVFVSNLMLNTVDVGTSLTNLDWLSRIHCGAGDWMGLKAALQQQEQEQQQNTPLVMMDENDTTTTTNDDDARLLFDVVLAAETVYTPASARDTATLFRRHLRPGTGQAYVATKRYYFGVGGGVNAFRSYCCRDNNDDNIKVETVAVYDNGRGNIRQLLRVQIRRAGDQHSTEAMVEG